MRTLDLFSGIGAFALAARWMGWETAAFVELNPFCQKVLAKHFPTVPLYSDIKEFHYEKEKELIGSIDLVCGGFPCQPYSISGKRKGNEDERALWGEMFRIIQDVQPAWVVGENVANFVNMGLDAACADLERAGYAVQAFVIPALAVNALHRRDRVWIVAYATKPRCKGGGCPGKSETEIAVAHYTDKDISGLISNTEISIESCFCGKNDGFSGRVDRLRIGALGNAVVPQVVYEIFKAIEKEATP